MLKEFSLVFIQTLITEKFMFQHTHIILQNYQETHINSNQTHSFGELSVLMTNSLEQKSI